jgi:hypothetical protein
MSHSQMAEHTNFVLRNIGSGKAPSDNEVERLHPRPAECGQQ